MTLGQSLADARNAAGLNVDSLATKTNIRPALLREFEENNLLMPVAILMLVDT